MLQWIAFLAVVCALSVALNRRFERVLAPALCGLMLLLYALAIPRVLSWVDWMAPVLLALTVASAIAALALRKLTPRALVVLWYVLAWNAADTVVGHARFWPVERAGALFVSVHHLCRFSAAPL